MRAALDPGLLATDLADYLVRRGVPFRQAHHLVGRAVRHAQELGLPLDRLSLDELQAIDSVFEEDVVEVFSFEASVSRRNVAGGTGPEAVEAQIRKAKECLS
jgi:argininosuccinate lyase